MTFLHVALVAYGLLNIGLGIEAAAKSPISLAAGGGAGILALIAAWVARRRPTVGYALGALVCVALLGRFLPKLLKEFQVYPGFVVVASSALMLVMLAVGHFASQRRA